MTDSEILSLMKQSPQEGHRALFEEYYSYVYAIVWDHIRGAGTHEDAEECVSDTWLRAWKAVPSDPPRKLGAYLTAVTRNIALDRLRMREADKRGGGEADRCLDELADILPSGYAPPETEVLFRDLMTRFVLSLRAEEREIFLFRYRNVETVSEIARITGKSPGAVKITLFRCRKKLRGYLKKEGIDV